MVEVDPITGQPIELSSWSELAKEAQKIKVMVRTRRFGKHVTVIVGLGKDIDIKSLGKTLKQKLACGGTVKDDMIELQGNHKEAVKKLLIEEGYKEEQIQA